MQGNVSYVVNLIKTFDFEGYELGTIAILKDNSLHWITDLEKIDGRR